MPGLENVLNIHPLFVHFPIALTFVAGLIVLFHLVTQREDYLRMASFMIYLSAVSVVFTLLSGYGAADSLGHDSPGHDLVHTHRDIMQVYTGLIVSLAVLQYLVNAKVWPWLKASWVKGVRLVLLAAALVVLTIGADRGGYMVFQRGVGVTLPESIDFDADSHDEGEAVAKDSTDADDHNADGHKH